MLNLDELFGKFLDKITLTDTYKDKITKGRDALRTKIGDKFKEKDRKKPKYYTQGSYAMSTAIMPLDDDFDLDNGIYLQGYTDDQSEWLAATTVHTWIKDVVDGHTDTPPVDKNTCVRVIYKDNYHIDLPIYIMGKDDDNNEVAFLAHKDKGWIKSDPKAFKEWFQEHVNNNGQVVRKLVKYLKAWKDYKKIDIKGMAITILVCNHLAITEDRNDISLLDTVVNIIDELEENFHCYKPVTPKTEDLFEDISETTKESILKGLNKLKENLDIAINEKINEKDATDLLKKSFGDRFPSGEDKNKDISNRAILPVNLGSDDSHFA